MNEYDATEQAYKSGYEKGFADAMISVEKAHKENEALRERLEHIERQNAYMQGILQTVEVIFGRDFAGVFRYE